jgi:hypothetical protein
MPQRKDPQGEARLALGHARFLVSIGDDLDYQCESLSRWHIRVRRSTCSVEIIG